VLIKRAFDPHCLDDCAVNGGIFGGSHGGLAVRQRYTTYKSFIHIPSTQKCIKFFDLAAARRTKVDFVEMVFTLRM
jgi:hypothetical protein